MIAFEENKARFAISSIKMSQFVLVTAYDGLYILGNFTAPKPKANKGIVEIERLRKDCQLKLSYYNMTDALGKKVIFHNVRSFAKHQADIFNDFYTGKLMSSFSPNPTLTTLTQATLNQTSIFYNHSCELTDHRRERQEDC